MFDGRATGVTLDAYVPQVLPSGPIEVSSGLELTKGQHRIRFTVIGTNSVSLGHGFGVDCLELRPGYSTHGVRHRKTCLRRSG
jgi:hypothetical protein